MKTLNYTIQYSDVLEYQKRKQARKKVYIATAKGKICCPGVCELCNKKAKTSAHHTDYGKPLDVTWLCKTCHGAVHQADHPLNPANIPQTNDEILLDQSDKLLVTFSLPIENFILIKRIAVKKGYSFSRVIREAVLKTYPVKDAKAVFNKRKRRKKDDGINSTVSERVQVLEYDKERMQQQKSQKVFIVRAKGDNLGERVELFSSLHSRHGGNASGVRWTYSKR